MYIQPQTYHEVSENEANQVLRPIYATEDTPKDTEILDEDQHGKIIDYEYKPSRQWQKDVDQSLDYKSDSELRPYLDVYIATIRESGLGPYGWVF